MDSVKTAVTIIYHAVRKGGESRILTKFPEDPLMRWNSWKKNRENFE